MSRKCRVGSPEGGKLWRIAIKDKFSRTGSKRKKEKKERKLGRGIPENREGEELSGSDFEGGATPRDGEWRPEGRNVTEGRIPLFMVWFQASPTVTRDSPHKCAPYMLGSVCLH